MLAADDFATTVAAVRRTITVDGSAADWAGLASGVMSLDTGGRAQLTCDVRFAWDPTYLYMLVQEGAGDTVTDEGPNAALYGTDSPGTGPWNYDTVSFWMDLDNSNDAENTRDFNPWFGFSSSARTDLYTARINNGTGLTVGPFLNANVATSGARTSNNRVIEARVRWSDLAATVDTARQPGGNLTAAIAAGFKFGCEPLLVDNDFNGQSFIGGAQYTTPTGADSNSRDLELLDFPAGVADWTIY